MSRFYLCCFWFGAFSILFVFAGFAWAMIWMGLTGDFIRPPRIIFLGMGGTITAAIVAVVGALVRVAMGKDPT